MSRVAWLSILFAAAGLAAELKYVAVITRHGVRSPTWTAARLAQYSVEPWPDWGVPPGNLTPHGHTLMQQFGAYYRTYFSSQGLLSQTGCGDAGRVYFWAHNEQRTLETARALTEGMHPGCAAAVHAAAEDEIDPLFGPIAAGLGKPDRALAAAAVSGRIGGNSQELLDLYRPAFEELERILAGPGARPPARILPNEPIPVAAGGDSLVDLTGALHTASTLSENLLLEYTNGMRGKDLGWGRLNSSNLRQIMALHAGYSDLARRTPYIARARGSNLLEHVLDSMRQAALGKPVPGALGKPADAALVIVGHDTNLSNISGMLGISWLLPGYQPNDPVPGGAGFRAVVDAGPEKAQRPRILHGSDTGADAGRRSIDDRGAPAQVVHLHPRMRHGGRQLRLFLGRLPAHAVGRHRPLLHEKLNVHPVRGTVVG